MRVLLALALACLIATACQKVDRDTRIQELDNFSRRIYTLASDVFHLSTSQLQLLLYSILTVWYTDQS